MSTPTTIDRMLERVEWTAEDGGPPEDRDPRLPYVTHHGTLDLLGCALRVYRLSDGRAIVNAEDLEALLKIGPL